MSSWTNGAFFVIWLVVHEQQEDRSVSQHQDVVDRNPLQGQGPRCLILEPLSIDVLLHDPEVLIVDLHGWWSRFPPIWDHIGNGFGKDVDVKYIVNFPLCGQGESIREV
jgi:hypothetical protein